MRNALFLLVALAPTLAHAAPILSDEVTFDHGYRYSERSESGERAVLRRVGDQLFFLSQGRYRDRLLLTRRTLDGKEIDTRSHVIPIREGEHFTDVALSGFDGVSIKLAYLSTGSGSNELRVHVRSLDPTTLAPIGDDLVASTVAARRNGLEMQWTGKVHVIAWMDDSSHVLTTRLRPDMSLDGEERVPEQGQSNGDFGFAYGARDGWIAFPNVAGELVMYRVSSDGMLADHKVHGAGWGGSMRIVPVGDRWIVAHESSGSGLSLRADTFDQDGNFVVSVFSRGTTPLSGFDLAANDSMAILCTRAFRSEPIVYRIDPINGVLSYEGTSLEPVPDRARGSAWSTRSLSAVWTGDDFAVAWNDSDGDRDCLIDHDPTFDVPSRFRRMTVSGELPDTAVTILNLGTRPRETSLVATPSGFLAVTRDDFSSEYVHAQPLDTDGRALGPASRIFGQTYRDEGCEWAVSRALRCRTFAGHAFVGHEWFSGSGQMDETGRTAIDVDELDESGTPIRHYALAPGGWVQSPGPIVQWDLAVNASSMFCTWSAAFSTNDQQAVNYLHTRLVDRAGNAPTQEWFVPGTRRTGYPTVAALDSSFVVILSDWSSGRYVLHRCFADPIRHNIPDGDVLFAEDGDQQRPWLIDGDGQFLCVWQYSAPGALNETDLHAVRLDRTGALLDSTPIVITTDAGPQGSVQGAWSGLNYVVTWLDESPLAPTLHANRVSAGGDVLDGDGFIVAENAAPPGTPAATADHRVAIPYGDRIRFVTDAVVPVAPLAFTTQSSREGVRIDWEIASDYGDRSTRIARRLLRTPEEIAHPPEGFVRVAADFVGAGPHSYRDTNVEAGEWYAYAIELSMEDGSSLWSAPSIVQAEALAPELALFAPWPNPAGSVARFHLSVPIAAAGASLELFDPSGRRVRRIAFDRIEPGLHEIAWDGLDDSGREAATGSYFARLTVGAKSRTARFVRVR